MKAKFNLLLSRDLPEPAETTLADASESVEVRRVRLIGDLAIESIHAHAFLNELNTRTGIDARFEKIKGFVYNRFIKKTVQLHHDLDTKTTIMSAIKHSLEQLKSDCNRPDFNGQLDRLCLDSATKYKDILNANVVYLGTNERIKFADYVSSKRVGISMIVHHDTLGDDVANAMREHVVGTCEKWIDALYGHMKGQKTSQRQGGMWRGWTTEEHRNRSWFAWACDTIGDALIALGGYIKISKPDNTGKQSDREQSDTRLEKLDSRFEQSDTRLEKLDSRFEQSDTRLEKLDSRFEQSDTRFGQSNSRLD